MKLWKSKKSATTSCVSAVSGKLNLSGNKNGYKDEDQNETISAATPTNQSSIHLANGLHQGETADTFSEDSDKRARRFSAKNLLLGHSIVSMLFPTSIFLHESSFLFLRLSTIQYSNFLFAKLCKTAVRNPARLPRQTVLV